MESTMTEVKISVIVPAFNVAPWLGKCLDSLLEQTYENLEIIVINDGSTDNTESVIGEYAGKSQRIKAIYQTNSGVTAARLRGLEEASGRWIGFCDGDDWTDPTMFARLLKNARDYRADISHCGFSLEYPDGHVEPHFGTGAIKLQDRNTALKDLLEERVVEPGVVNKLFRRELFQGLKDWMDTTVKNNEDMLMNFYLFSQAERAVFEDICPYRYRVRMGSASRGRVSVQKVMDPIRVRKRILEECEEQLRDTATEALLRHALHGYADLASSGNRQMAESLRLVRREISDHSDQLQLLSPRNRLMCRMICLCPELMRLTFRCYGLLGGIIS